MNSDPYFKNFRLVIHESGVKNAISSPTKPIRIVSNNRHLTGVAIKSKRRMIPSRRSRELIYRGEKLGHRPAGTRPPLLPFAFELVTHARTYPHSAAIPVQSSARFQTGAFRPVFEDVWKRLNERIRSFFGGFTIEKLTSTERKQNVNENDVNVRLG